MLEEKTLREERPTFLAPPPPQQPPPIILNGRSGRVGILAEGDVVLLTTSLGSDKSGSWEEREREGERERGRERKRDRERKRKREREKE